MRIFVCLDEGRFSLLLYILLNNIAPIFALVAVGYHIGKKFNLDIYTLSKINFYVFIPAVIFVKIYEADIDLDLIRAVVFTLGFAVIQLILSSFTINTAFIKIARN